MRFLSLLRIASPTLEVFLVEREGDAVALGVLAAHVLKVRSDHCRAAEEHAHLINCIRIDSPPPKSEVKKVKGNSEYV
jgi:hypothetical protein